MMVLVLTLVICVGVAVFAYIYVKKLSETQESVESNTAAIGTERKNRLGSFKVLVDEVNSANKDMTGSIMKKVDENTKNMTDMSDTLASTEGIFAMDGNDSSVNIFDKPGHSLPNLKVMKRLFATAGMTVEDVDEDGTNVKICGKATAEDSAARCIEFPDSAGDTVLRGIGKTGRIKVDDMLTADKGITTSNVTVPSGGGILSDGDILIQGRGGSEGKMVIGDKKLVSTFSDGVEYTASKFTVSGELRAGKVIVPVSSELGVGQEGQIIVTPAGIMVYQGSLWHEVPFST